MFSIPTNVKVSRPFGKFISTVYGAFAISNTYKNIGFANPINNANNALRISKLQGFSASVMGPPNERNNCQIVIKNNIVQAIYCITENAVLTNGKYSSIASISVPSAFRNIPDTASISFVVVSLTQSTMPSKIQFNKHHLLFYALDLADVVSTRN